jgi:hypothetical protein
MINEELAECAKINFENLERALPAITKHPFYAIAKGQLDEALGDEGALERRLASVEKEKEAEDARLFDL